jgi:hypothetical protein
MTATQAPTLDELLTEFETATAKRGPTLEELFPPPSGPDESELRRRVQETQALRERFTALQQAEARDEEERARKLADAEERVRMAKETRDVVTLALASLRNVSTSPIVHNAPSGRQMMAMSDRQFDELLNPD